MRWLTPVTQDRPDTAFAVSGLQFLWSRGQDLNLRPSGYEPDELPDCSTPQYSIGAEARERMIVRHIGECNGRLGVCTAAHPESWAPTGAALHRPDRLW